jgi:SAM-dependent methyltransferase
MDLREQLRGAIEPAAAVLNYQPFILSDEVQTGAAYSWVCGSDPRVAPPLVFRQKELSADDWRLAAEANGRLRAMYDDLLDEIARRFPGGSLLDVACNNGYFPVGAELRGMRGTGMDLGDYSNSVSLLNRVLGTRARFANVAYDSRTHALPDLGKFDVTVMSAIMCHLPDPLNFLAAVGRVTTRALLFWGQMVETDALVVSLQAPHPSLSGLADFPHCFNDNTRVSRGLFHEAMRQMGFKEIVEIPPRPTWLMQFSAARNIPLEREFKEGSAHLALLAIR